MIRLSFAFIAFSLLSSTSLHGIEREKGSAYIFTTQVLKLDRRNGKMIVSYSEAGKSMLKDDSKLVMNNYDDLSKTLEATVTKIHDSKPWVMIEVTKGDYSKIEKGFKYKTTVIAPVNKPEK